MEEGAAPPARPAPVQQSLPRPAPRPASLVRDRVAHVRSLLLGPAPDSPGYAVFMNTLRGTLLRPPTDGPATPHTPADAALRALDALGVIDAEPLVPDLVDTFISMSSGEVSRVFEDGQVDPELLVRGLMPRPMFFSDAKAHRECDCVKGNGMWNALTPLRSRRVCLAHCCIL